MAHRSTLTGVVPKKHGGDDGDSYPHNGYVSYDIWRTGQTVKQQTAGGNLKEKPESF